MQLKKNIRLQNKYRIIKAINNGGLGIVYEGLDQHNKQIAIKEYFPINIAKREANGVDVIALYSKKKIFENWRSQFQKEAEFLKHFKNKDHFVNILDFIYENNTNYIVMEYLSGGNIFDLIDSDSLLRKNLFRSGKTWCISHRLRYNLS
ncbi:serine/threonine protein kinase [Candidatus Magnetomorum sp. HK-1]|nr:serine/threonine protein kinase [Candidatus Magnetomorum sp. HK-1]